MADNSFTSIRSLLGALAKALNLINPYVEHHHEQTAYFSYFLARRMGLDDEAVHTVVYAALLHDVGTIVHEEPKTLRELEGRAREYAYIGAEMLRDLPNFGPISDVIRYCQTPWSILREEITDSACMVCARSASVIHLADVLASHIDPDKRVLNQVDGLCAMAEAQRGRAFLPEAVDALLAFRDMEVFWMDALKNPTFLMLFTGEFHRVTLEQTLELTKLMSRIIDYRSSFTAMHSAGVSAAAKALAKLSGMSAEDCIKMEIAGNLHDVGKLAVPREILEKNGKLTREEFNIIREHPYYTRLILMDVEGFNEIANWAGLHHEKLNGKGYPFHFDGSVLDLGSRIMAVADIFSAITEDRPYRKGMPKEKALSVLREDAARGEIDAELVELLASHYEQVDAERARSSAAAGSHYADYFTTHQAI